MQKPPPDQSGSFLTIDSQDIFQALCALLAPETTYHSSSISSADVASTGVQALCTVFVVLEQSLHTDPTFEPCLGHFRIYSECCRQVL